MRCVSCQRNIAAGVEAQKMIVEYRQDDTGTKIFGYMMSDGPLSAATGRIERGWHHKCYHIARKRAARGDAVTGRVIANTPTAYDIEQLVLSRDDLAALGMSEAQARAQGTLSLSTRLSRLREIAQTVGKGVGDAVVQEAFAADQHGGPYVHQHTHRLETYQLIAHLEYAHGNRDAGLFRSGSGLQDAHQGLHAAQALEAIRARRADDPDAETDTERDWRTQYTADIE
jgi:hypothetical protein